MKRSVSVAAAHFDVIGRGSEVLAEVVPLRVERVVVAERDEYRQVMRLCRVVEVQCIGEYGHHPARVYHIAQNQSEGCASVVSERVHEMFQIFGCFVYMHVRADVKRVCAGYRDVRSAVLRDVLHALYEALVYVVTRRVDEACHVDCVASEQKCRKSIYSFSYHLYEIPRFMND